LSYKILNRDHELKITLETNLQNPSSLRLNCYKNNNHSTIAHQYEPSVDGNIVVFEVLNRHFNVNDVITKMMVVLAGSTPLYALNEGISIMVDGEESEVYKAENNSVVLDDGEPVKVNPLDTNNFAVKFDDNELHDVRAVYKGNKEIGVAFTDKIFVTPEQRPDDGGTYLRGKYTITCTKFKKTMKYMETPDWEWVLKKGETAVPNKVVEKVLTPDGVATQANTDSQGRITQGRPLMNVLKSWTVGTHRIGVQFFHYDDDPDDKTTLTDNWQVLKIVKGDVVLSASYIGGKGKVVRITMTDVQGNALTNRKLVININGSKKIKSTDKYGKVDIAMNKKGYYKFIIVFNGDTNFNKKTIKWNRKIV
jgi:hypothetical protein